jgi:hypothetical protein
MPACFHSASQHKGLQTPLIGALNPVVAGGGVVHCLAHTVCMMRPKLLNVLLHVTLHRVALSATGSCQLSAAGVTNLYKPSLGIFLLSRSRY